MSKMRKKLLRVLSVCLSVLLIAGQCMTPFQVQAATRQDGEFYVFLAEYLDDNYMLDRLDQVMAHQILYTAMDQQSEAAKLAVTLQNMASDWGYALDGKRDLYEQVLLELIHNHVKGDLFRQKVEEERVQIEYEILDFVKNSFEIDNVIEDNVELAARVSKMDFSTWEDVLKLPKEIWMENIDKLATKFELPVSGAYLYSVGFDTMEFMCELIMYQQLKNRVDGIYMVVEEIYRQANDTDLMVASKKILDKLDALRSPDVWKLVEECVENGYVDNLAVTTIKDLTMTALNVVGIAIDTIGLLSNLVFKSDVLAKTQLLLEVELEIESAIKDVIRRKQNAYKSNAKNSSVLVHSFMMLYEAYEYGLELTKKYNDTVFDATQNIININQNAEMTYIERAALEKASYTHDEFEDALKTWEGILVTDRSLFYSGWLEYQKRYMGEAKDSLLNYLDKVYISNLEFEEKVVTLDYETVKDSTQILSKPVITPIDATELMLLYTSSDPSVLSLESENLYMVRVHQPGTVTVTAETPDGFYSAEQKIIITDTQKETREPEVAAKETDYSEYYETNQDGITVTGLIGDFVEVTEDLKHVTYWIPEEIDGKAVTEVDFSKLHSSYAQTARASVEIRKVVLPDSVKRVADWCFSPFEYVDVVLNEGLESIGKNAFYFCRGTDDIVLPSSLKEIGESAFSSMFGVRNVYICSPLLKEIPDMCFHMSDFSQVIFVGEHPQLTSIGEYGMAGFECVNLPDSIEVIGRHAFKGSTLYSLPASLRDIGEESFLGTVLRVDRLPASVKSIGKRAFLSAEYEELSIPNTVEFIGEEAFGSQSSKIITTYGDSGQSGTGVGETGMLSGASYFELPFSMKVLKKPFGDVVSGNVQIYWTNGIDEIEYGGDPNVVGPLNHLSLYLKESDDLGDYRFDDHIFTVNEYFDYIEIPSHYLDQTDVTLSGGWMKEVVIIGKKDNGNLNRYVAILRDAIDIGGRIVYKDSEGNKTLLYENFPSSYEKESLAASENQADYMLSELSLLENQVSDAVSDMSITISYGDSIKERVGESPKLILQCWEDGEETEAERAALLGDYMIFEDLYLRQPVYQYFTIDVSGSGSAVDMADGEYIISLKLEAVGMNKENVGLYHMNESGRITRIPVFFQSDKFDCTITFRTKELGQFALVALNNKKDDIPYSYREEFHGPYEEEPQHMDQEHSVTYENKEGTQTFISDNTEDEGTVTIRRPEIRDEKKDEIGSYYQIDSDIIPKEEERKESLTITEEILADMEKWETIENSLVEIQTETANTTIQVALTKNPESNRNVQIFRADGNGGPDMNAALERSHVSALEKNDISELITANGMDYYEVELEEEGTYYFMLTVSEDAYVREETGGASSESSGETPDETTAESVEISENEEPIAVSEDENQSLGVISVIGIAGVLVLIGIVCFMKKRK
ncbi:MAG: leucine-rich repeat protein [Lachnospiraceae bacterium]|nr:leucine-rich repeat protein [Lachnospiraceae bacterium]